MAIDIKKPHSKGLEGAQAMANALAKDLAERFGVAYGWDGDQMHFERMGVSGNIKVTDATIHVTAELNSFISYLEPAVTEKINHYLNEHFA